MIRARRIQIPRAVARRQRPAILPTLADGWFSVAPALVVAAFGLPGTFWHAAAVLASAVAAQVAVDFASAALRLRCGLGLNVRDQLNGFAFVTTGRHRRSSPGQPTIAAEALVHRVGLRRRHGDREVLDLPNDWRAASPSARRRRVHRPVRSVPRCCRRR